jgi:hypothetical protein
MGNGINTPRFSASASLISPSLQAKGINTQVAQPVESATTPQGDLYVPFSSKKASVAPQQQALLPKLGLLATAAGALSALTKFAR